LVFPRKCGGREKERGEAAFLNLQRFVIRL
jgi:hypothetical protein